ncbi:hypothetical protein [uncultured Alistipes sp.]|uniref:hypothetical protein n=1 Tax=uncultured Alistipes sp. TaxID=538949 RepID=UPI00262C8593|nr:hypothetical protein [uncultured Alistipes sp.]
MKTIEERAKEYEKKYYDGAASECRLAFIRDAQSERAELTRWHDPKEELPPNDARVLCKVTGCAYTEYLVLNWYENIWWAYLYNADDEGWHQFFGQVIGWREIHE